MNTIKNMQQLINKINYLTSLYNAGTPLVSDKEWDELYDKLKNLERESGITYPDSPTQSIYFQNMDILEKIEHNHPMLSLDKTKDWQEFLNYFGNNDVVGMLKLDGLTCSLRYLNGKLVSAETRGNGLIGENILHNAKVISSIPQTIKYQSELILDGEIICTTQNFEKFSNEYSNARNFAAGSIRLLDSKECFKRDLTFVVWHIVKGYDETTVIDKFNHAELDGFTVTPWTRGLQLDAKDFLTNKAKELGYPIDGLVGRFNNIAYGESLGSTGHHSKAAYAFKFYDEEYETKLLDIEWSMGRTGVLTPVAIYEPVEIEGSICNRASLHNLSVLYEVMHGGAYVNEPITVAKMNMIIPQIMSAQTSIPKGAKLIQLPTKCPVCGDALEVIESDTGIKNLCCLNKACQGKLLNRLVHFASRNAMDIKGLSEATFSNLIDWGWINDIPDIFNLSQYKDEWIKKPNYGKVSVNNALAAIEKSKTCTLDSFITALGIPLIGKSVAAELIKAISTYEELREKIDNGYDFSQLDGFAEEKTQALLNYDWTAADIIYPMLTITSNSSALGTNEKTLENLTFVITGSLTMYKNRAVLESVIKDKGGKVSSSISSRTNYLINNDTTSMSKKNLQAQKNNIPIISEKDFFEKFLS